MLEFYLNNHALVINTDTSIVLSWKNPACIFDEFSGDAGLGIDVPVNEFTKPIFGNPERFEKRTSTAKLEYPNFEVRYSGVLLMTGTLILNSASTENYSGWLRSSVGNIKKDSAEKHISESISFNQEKLFENKADYDPTQDDYGCPEIMNVEFFAEKGQKTTVMREVPNPNYSDFWGDITFWSSNDNHSTMEEEEEVEDFTEAFRRTSDHLVNKKNPDGTVQITNSITLANAKYIAEELDVSVISPMLFLNYILKSLFKDNGIFLDENFIESHEDLCKLIMYNNFDITKMIYTDDGSKVYQQFFGDTGNDYTFDHTVAYDVQNVSRNADAPFFYKDLLPAINLEDFLLSVQNLTNTFFFFSSKQNKVDNIDRETIFTSPAIDIASHLSGFWEIGEKKDSTIKFTFEHENADVIFSDIWKDIEDLRYLEKEPVENIEVLKAIEDPEVAEIRKLIDHGTYLQFKLYLSEEVDPISGDPIQVKKLGWIPISFAFQNAFVNRGKDEEETIETQFGTLIGLETPKTEQHGNIFSELFTKESFSPRLLFYLGDNNACFRTDNLSMDWEAEEIGMIEKRHPLWSRFWSSRQPVEIEADFPLNVLDLVIRNIYKKFISHEGEFMIESMECEFGTNGIGTAKIKGYKIDFAPVTTSLTTVWKYSDMVYPDTFLDFGDIDIYVPLIFDFY